MKFMNYEFKKSRYPLIPISLSILFLFLIIKFSFEIIPVTFNVEFNRKVNDTFFVCVKDYCRALEANSGLGEMTGYANIKSAVFNKDDVEYKKIKRGDIFFAIPKEFKNPQNVIEKIDLYIGDNIYHYDFSDVLKFQNKVVPITLSSTGQKLDYIVYSFEKLLPLNVLQSPLVEFIKQDLKNYKDYKVIVYSTLKNKPKELEDEKIEWKQVNEILQKIDKQDSKTVVYFDSSAVDFIMASIQSAGMKVYNTNSVKIGKIVY